MITMPFQDSICNLQDFKLGQSVAKINENIIFGTKLFKMVEVLS